MRAPTFRNGLAALLLVLPVVAGARVTAPATTDRDAFCAGPRSAEACIDKNGNIIPTTDNTQTLGTSALRYNKLTLGTNGLVFGDGSNQTTAAGSGVWGVNGSIIYYNGGNVGIGTNLAATPLDVNGVAQFGSGATKSTFTSVGWLLLSPNAQLQLSGANGYITGSSSVTASAFFGDGSHLTGVPVTTAVQNLQIFQSTVSPVVATLGASTNTLNAGVTGNGAGWTASTNTVVTGSTTVLGAGGVGVSYGVTAGSATIGSGANSVLMNSPSASTVLQVGSNGGGNGLGALVSRGATTNFWETTDGTKDWAGGCDNSQTFCKMGTISNHDVAVVSNNADRIHVASGGNVGIGTTNPATTLDVNGSAQFGSGATKSTFTASGFLTITGSTLTVASSGIISAPSQPGIRAYLGIGGQNIANSVITPIYMSGTSFSQGGMFLNAASSGTFVVPPGGAGVYQVNCTAGDFAANATGLRILYIYKNAVLLNAASQAGSTQVSADLAVSTVINAVAGDAFSCQVFQNSGVALTIGADNNGYSGISVIKVW